MKSIEFKCPDYFEKFKCIGGECEDSCCIGWDIDIDKNTYNYYEKCSCGDINIKDNIYRNEDYASEEIDFGKVKLTESKKCPFLDDKNYCEIHSKMGEGCLSNTCSHFPRIINKIDEDYEISLDLSCPEAARIVLGSEEKIKFINKEISLNKYIVASEFDTNDEEYEDLPIRYFKEIRDYCIKIVQTRELKLKERLYVLGDFLVDLEKAGKQDLESVPRFIEKYDIEYSAGFYEKDDINYVMQISLFKNLIDSLDIYNETDSAEFKRYTKEVLDGFNIKSEEDIEENSDMFIDWFVDYTEKYIDENSSIFENYIVNFIYNNLFPYSESDSMFEGYIMLLIRYALMRFYLVGRYRVNKEESKESLIKFIQVFSKAIEHDKDYMSEIFDYIIENEFDNTEFSEMLL